MMRFSVITPNYNGAAFLEEAIRSVVDQRTASVDLEYIVVDGQSTDDSHDIIDRYRDRIDTVIIEADHGPASAINKGLTIATGDMLAWLNADDIYYPGTLQRITDAVSGFALPSFVFGRCPILDTRGKEIRRGITRFKEVFFPIHSRFVYQCINYISQPALFFSRTAYQATSPLREDMVAAWDYEFILRIWRQGKGIYLPGDPLAAFRWHNASISGRNFAVQFKEELAAVAHDAGRFAPQTLIHHGVRWGIVGAYQAMLLANARRQQKKSAD
jgi:glycosyltransferase involved in cell wall biosynthesis